MLMFLCLILPGLIAGYALIARPLLHRIPAFAAFYAEADGFWAKVWALCGNSLTVAWGYIVGGAGVALTAIGPIATMLGDPELKTQITSTLQGNPQVLGYVMFGISVITIAARLRSIIGGN